MDTNRLIGCWIDGAVPRTSWERRLKLLDLLRLVEDRHDIIESFESVTEPEARGEFGITEEDNLIDHISAMLERDNLQLICEAGDVIITEEIKE